MHHAQALGCAQQNPYLLAVCICLIGLWPAPGAAQQPEAPTVASLGGGSALKSTLVSRIPSIHQMAIKSGAWARSKGATAQVRAYGDRLVRDHTLSDQKVLDFAEKQGIPVGDPTPANAEEEQEMKERTSTMEQLPTLQ